VFDFRFTQDMGYGFVLRNAGRVSLLDLFRVSASPSLRNSFVWWLAFCLVALIERSSHEGRAARDRYERGLDEPVGLHR